jgi:hypothetical protein
MGAPAIFEKQIEIKLLHPASTLESRIQVAEKARTVSFKQEMTVVGSEMNYSQTTVLEIYGRSFEHKDENTLIRIR